MLKFNKNNFVNSQIIIIILIILLIILGIQLFKNNNNDRIIIKNKLVKTKYYELKEILGSPNY